MPFGQPPFTRDYLDVLIDRRLGLGGRGVSADTFMRRPGGVEGAYVPDFNTPAPPRRSSALRQGLAGAFSDTGQEAFGSGVQAGLQQPDFLSALAASFGTSLGAGARGRRAESAAAAAKAEQDRAYGLKERGVAAVEKNAEANTTRANRAPSTGHRAEDLTAEYDFLANTLGWDDETIDKYFQSRGLGGRGAGGGGAGGRQTDLDKVAQGLVQTGRAPDLNTAYVMARTLTQQPQQVGSITRSVMDPNTFNMTTVRVSVARRIDPVTGQFQLIDDRGNSVTDSDMQTFQANPAGYSGGTGGPANAPLAPPPLPPAPVSMVPSHAPTGAVPPAATPAAVPGGATPLVGPRMGDFVPGVQGVSEDQVIQAILTEGPGDPEVVRQYAAGRGPLGNSTKIKAAAAQVLSAGVQ